MLVRLAALVESLFFSAIIVTWVAFVSTGLPEWLLLFCLAILGAWLISEE